MNLTEARAELAGRGFDYLPAGRMTIMLNNARNVFEDAWPWPWLWKSLGGSPPLPILDLKYVMMVKSAITNSELLGLDYRQVADNGTDLTMPGIPDYWYLEDGGASEVMRVWPVNTAGINVTYVAESPELVDPLDEPLIPERYQPVWIDLAVIQAYKDSDNFTAAGALQADVNARLGQIIERYETRNRQHAGFLSHRSYAGDDC